MIFRVPDLDNHSFEKALNYSYCTAPCLAEQAKSCADDFETVVHCSPHLVLQPGAEKMAGTIEFQITTQQEVEEAANSGSGTNTPLLG